jgi:iron-sulfur cluster assembly protein
MISMTSEAATLISALLGDSDLPDSAGLRLSTDPTVGSLAMSLIPQPNSSDTVVDCEGALLFVAPTVAYRLGDQILTAQLHDRPAFYLISN